MLRTSRFMLFCQLSAPSAGKIWVKSKIQFDSLVKVKKHHYIFINLQFIKFLNNNNYYTDYLIIF